MQYPVVVTAFEKLLLGGCLPVAATVQAWGVIAALGLAAAPFYLAPLLAVLYYLFALPLPSSFAAGSRKKSIGRLCMRHPLHVSSLHAPALNRVLCMLQLCMSASHVTALHVSAWDVAFFACVLFA